MISILGYGCSSAAGRGKARYWSGLVEGRDHSHPLDLTSCRVTAAPASACSFPERASSMKERPERAPSMKERLVGELLFALSETGFQPGGPLGVIFASSKGCLEDFVWEAEERREDPLTPCLDALVERAGLLPVRRLCVSNACASSHSALFLASIWLKSQEVTDVLVLAADGIGPFVTQGFHSLSALSPTRARPFAANRDGLRLGEAAAAVWLSTGRQGDLRLRGAGLDVEGYAVTRPSESGASLKRAIALAFGTDERRADLVLAHGTATAANDAVEDRALVDIFGQPTPFVTATKWSIGHTLGASGLMDLIAGGECLRLGRAFALANTEVIDDNFRARYLSRGGPELDASPRECLITSLGFGGVHAAIRLGLTEGGAA